MKHVSICEEDKLYSWCIPSYYDENVEPWKYPDKTNSTLPWIYNFRFDILDEENAYKVESHFMGQEGSHINIVFQFIINYIIFLIPCLLGAGYWGIKFCGIEFFRI